MNDKEKIEEIRQKLETIKKIHDEFENYLYYDGYEGKGEPRQSPTKKDLKDALKQIGSIFER